MAYINLIDLIYPTGSIYQTTSSTNPQTLFGGSWSRITDRFLIGCGNTYSNGGTGGKTTHTLTINEMPKHAHGTYGGWGAGSYNAGAFRTDQNSPQTYWGDTGQNGGGQLTTICHPTLASIFGRDFLRKLQGTIFQTCQSCFATHPKLTLGGVR